MSRPPAPTRVHTRPRRSSDREGMRDANLALITRAAFAAPTPLSRADLAKLTLVSPATVTRLVDDLVRGGILREGDPAPIMGPGRPSTPLVPSGDRFAALGLQINVSRLTARIIDLSGAVVADVYVERDLVDTSPSETLAELAGLVSDMMATRHGHRLVGAGLALPGLVDTGAGRLRLAPNLGWADVDVRAALAPVLHALPLAIDNEATLGALAAARSAPGRPVDLGDFLYVSGEVGIGGAAVIHGEVMRGERGWAGEIGHVCVSVDGPTCRCGSTGCLETYAGRRALLARAGLPRTATTDDFAGALRAGDMAARQAVADAGLAFAVALGGVMNVLDTSTVVLGGDLALIGEPLVAAIEQHLAGRVLHSRWAAPVVILGRSDRSASATGAAYLQLERLIADPEPALKSAE